MVSNCEFVTFTGIMGQVWYLIVSIPDLCTLTYFEVIASCKAIFQNSISSHRNSLLDNLRGPIYNWCILMYI